MKKLLLSLLIAAFAVTLPAGAAGKKPKALTTEQKEFAEKHNLLKNGELDRKAVKGLSGADKEAFEKLFPVHKKK